MNLIFFFTASLFPVFVCVHGFEQSKKKKKLLKLFFFSFFSFGVGAFLFCCDGAVSNAKCFVFFSFFSYKLNFDCRSNATCFFVVVCFACGSCGLLISWRKTKKIRFRRLRRSGREWLLGTLSSFPIPSVWMKDFFVRQCRVVKSQRMN